MHTNSVLCRLFADLVHTLSRVNVFHSYAAAQPAGAYGPFLLGLRSTGGSAMAAGSYAYLGEAGVVWAGAALLGEAAGPPPATALLGEAGGTSAAALLGEAVMAAAALEGEAAAAAAAAFEGEAAAAAAPAGGGATPAAAGRRPFGRSGCGCRRNHDFRG